MRRVMLILAMVMALGLLLVAGCRDKAPSSELDRFVARIAKLEGQALDDTLRQMASGGPPNAGFASYLLGNRYYVAAGEAAAARGWSDSSLVALLDSAEIHFNAAISADSTMIEPMVNLGSLWDDRAEQTTDQAKRPEFVAKAEKLVAKQLKFVFKNVPLRDLLGYVRTLDVVVRDFKDAAAEVELGHMSED